MEGGLSAEHLTVFVGSSGSFRFFDAILFDTFRQIPRHKTRAQN